MRHIRTITTKQVKHGKVVGGKVKGNFVMQSSVLCLDIQHRLKDINH